MKLKDFKIQSEAEDSFHLVHPSGKSFTVEKKGLSSRAQSEIQKLKGPQKLSDGGGVVPAALAPNSPSTPSYAPQQVAQYDVPLTTQDPVAAQSPAPSQSSGASGSWDQSQAPAPANQSPVDPLVQKGLDTDAVYDKQLGDMKKYTDSMGASAGQAAQAYKQYNDQLAQMQTPQQIADNYKEKDDELMQQFMSSKVDPNRLMNNASTGSKILAGIGIALAGAGGGASGKNVALDSMNNAINHDIESQQTDQSNKMNLWKMNRERMQDDQHATLATQNQMLTAMQAKAAMAGSTATSAQARLQASQLVSQIEQQKAQNRMRLGLLSQGAQGGSASRANPLDLVTSMVPEAQQKQVVSELGQSQSASENEDKIKQLFFQAAKDTRPWTGGVGSVRNAVPGYTPPSIKGLNLLYDPLIHDQEGRINELEQQHVQANSPQFGDSDETVNKKWDAIKAFIEHKKAAPTAREFGINTDNFQSTTSNPVARLNPQQQQFYAWAKSNPGPKADLVLKKLGVQ